VTAANGPVPVTAAARRTRLDALDVGIAVVVAAVIIAGVLTDRFFSLANARAILASTALTGITAVGATLVMIAGSAVSLAVSQTATVVAMIFLATQQLGLAAAIVLALLCGAAITALQGAIVGFWAANPIVLTIAAGFAVGGAAPGSAAGPPSIPGSARSTGSTPRRSGCHSPSTCCWR
jgi:ribose/xylose/arabinose/galactoside ABC-type transport system permease subunit